jgi:hypothetical protein
VRARRDQPTFVTPNVRKKPKVARPVVTEKAYAPEYALDEGMYESILGIIRNMTHVMERSPSAFGAMSEEDIRQHFLVQLNGQYEGGATGETFNFEGKTDILVREHDRNVFIAECTFWTGPSGLTKTLDQILGYLSWRDTKTAILLFVNNKKFSAVVDQVVPTVEAHTN